MSRPSVLLDVDGVLGDWHTPTVLLANRLFGLDADPADQDTWEMLDWLKLTSEQAEQLFHEIKKPGFHQRIKPYPYTVAGVKALMEIADISIVTAPIHGATWCFERWEWLWEHFGIPAKSVTHTHEKHKFDGDVFVDDKPSNIERWAQHHPTGDALLWHQPSTANMGMGLRRVTSWNEVFNIVKSRSEANVGMAR